MGYAPVVALKRLFDDTGLTPADIDIIEVNEAFASQAVAVIRDAGLDPAKTNPTAGPSRWATRSAPPAPCSRCVRRWGCTVVMASTRSSPCASAAVRRSPHCCAARAEAARGAGHVAAAQVNLRAARASAQTGGRGRSRRRAEISLDQAHRPGIAACRDFRPWSREERGAHLPTPGRSNASAARRHRITDPHCKGILTFSANVTWERLVLNHLPPRRIHVRRHCCARTGFHPGSGQ